MGAARPPIERGGGSPGESESIQVLASATGADFDARPIFACNQCGKYTHQYARDLKQPCMGHKFDEHAKRKIQAMEQHRHPAATHGTKHSTTTILQPPGWIPLVNVMYNLRHDIPLH